MIYQFILYCKKKEKASSYDRISMISMESRNFDHSEVKVSAFPSLLLDLRDYVTSKPYSLPRQKPEIRLSSMRSLQILKHESN